MQREVSTYGELVEFIFKNGGIVIAEFNNPWSAPCKLIQPFVQTFKHQYEMSVAKIDTDKSQQLSIKFDIHAIPTFILLRKSSGQVATVDLVVSAHVEKLRKLFESGYNIKNNKN